MDTTIEEKNEVLEVSDVINDFEYIEINVKGLPVRIKPF
jgi:hypothetical protein